MFVSIIDMTLGIIPHGHSFTFTYLRIFSQNIGTNELLDDFLGMERENCRV